MSPRARVGGRPGLMNCMGQRGRDMAARRSLHRFGIAGLGCTLLLVPVGCDLGGSSRKRTAPTACASERTVSSTMQDIATVSRGVEVGPFDVVVSGTGKATLAWTAAP